jgi:hypothetical protein
MLDRLNKSKKLVVRASFGGVLRGGFQTCNFLSKFIHWSDFKTRNFLSKFIQCAQVFLV